MAPDSLPLSKSPTEISMVAHSYQKFIKKEIPENVFQSKKVIALQNHHRLCNKEQHSQLPCETTAI